MGRESWQRSVHPSSGFPSPLILREPYATQAECLHDRGNHVYGVSLHAEAAQIPSILGHCRTGVTQVYVLERAAPTHGSR